MNTDNFWIAGLILAILMVIFFLPVTLICMEYALKILKPFVQWLHDEQIRTKREIEELEKRKKK